MIALDFTGLKDASHLLGALAHERIAFKAANAAARKFQAEVGKTLKIQEPNSRIHARWKFEGSGARVFIGSPSALRIEHGTGLHGPYRHSFMIQPKPRGKWRKGQRGKGYALKLPGGVFVRRVLEHPGAPARPFFYKTAENSKLAMLAAAKAAIAKKLREARS